MTERSQRFYNHFSDMAQAIDSRRRAAARAAKLHAGEAAIKELKFNWEHREFFAIYRADDEGKSLHFVDDSFAAILDYLDEVACFHWVDSAHQPAFRARLSELRSATSPPEYPITIPANPQHPRRDTYMIRPITVEDLVSAIEKMLKHLDAERKRSRDEMERYCMDD